MTSWGNWPHNCSTPSLPITLKLRFSFSKGFCLQIVLIPVEVILFSHRLSSFRLGNPWSSISSLSSTRRYPSILNQILTQCKHDQSTHFTNSSEHSIVQGIALVTSTHYVVARLTQQQFLKVIEFGDVCQLWLCDRILLCISLQFTDPQSLQISHSTDRELKK